MFLKKKVHTLGTIVQNFFFLSWYSGSFLVFTDLALPSMDPGEGFWLHDMREYRGNNVYSYRITRDLT